MAATAVSGQRTGTPDTVIRLDGVGWDTYSALREAPENNGVRMTYDRGVLILMSPSIRHERIAGLVGQFVVEWMLLKEIPFISCGTVTCQREDLERGLEPDKSFYVQHEQMMRDRDELNLREDPPPDLVIEVDVASSSARKLSVYAALGVPEVWHWRGNHLELLVLRRDRYEPNSDSAALPGFPFDVVSQLLAERHERDDGALLLGFRQSVS